MKLERVELFLVRLPLKAPYETSGSRETHQTRVIARVESEGIVAWGESVAPETPWYSGETPETVWWLLDEIAIPRLFAADLGGPNDVSRTLGWIKDHRMAKATLEMAVWDLFAKAAKVPLSKLLGGTRDRILCGVAIGIQPSIDALLDKIAKELEGGYQRVKVKIKPGWDLEPVRVLRGLFGDIPLMVDANAAYSLNDARHIAALDPFDLMMIEQPLEYDDLGDHAMLQKQLRTAICLDESLETPRRAEEALIGGACRIINIKPGRVGGHAQSIRMHDIAVAHGAPVWHGGMLESGIGRAHNIHLSTLPGFTLPGDVAASRRYFAPDVIDPEIVVRPDGTIAVPSGPGIGVHVVEDRVARACVERLELRQH
jgi:O-succinylbenzoate synthase